MNHFTSQRDTFVSTEGNAWYARNLDDLFCALSMREHVVSRIATHLPEKSRNTVMEVGCAAGRGLVALAEMRLVEGIGVDPSAEAIEYGMRQYPGLRLVQGTADQLPQDDNSVDVLWFGFCLYLVDRALLARAVAEADRVLKDGGLLVINDFDPDYPRMRKYRHCDGIWSYKMDYSSLFTANPAYVVVEKSSFSHACLQWEADPQERVGLWLCRKNLGLGYEKS
jgi:ubiquinone/menaquinone biosynthesis C-methylase UbiE